MKAIIVLFEGDLDSLKQRQICKDLAESLMANIQCDIEKVSVTFLEDEEVESRLLQPTIQSESKTIDEIPNQIKKVLNALLNRVGPPTLMTKTAYRSALLNRLQTDKQLRESLEFHLLMNEKVQQRDDIKAILKDHGLSHFPEYNQDVRLLYELFDYGKI